MTSVYCAELLNSLNSALWSLTYLPSILSTTDLELRFSCFILKATFRYIYLTSERVNRIYFSSVGWRQKAERGVKHLKPRPELLKPGDKYFSIMVISDTSCPHWLHRYLATTGVCVRLRGNKVFSSFFARVRSVKD